jgi:polysaccharide export outer membrane protein
MDIRSGQRDPESLPYAFVRITPKVTAVLEKAAPRLVSEFSDRRPPKDIRFGIGDIVSVTVFEASTGGLFIPSEAGVRPGNFITMPTQAVDSQGNISVPYAGTIRAKGRTPVEVQQAITDALKNRAIEPQVIVSTAEQRTSQISVLGDVNRPSRIPANAAGERVLDVIARAGGPAGPAPDEWIMLERNGRRALSPFGALIYEPRNNIWAHPEDTIFLYREPQTFLAFGAFGGAGNGQIQNQIPFGGVWRLSLAEAIGRAAGINDNLADPSSIFLYRGETRETAQALGIDLTPFQGPIIPVIYNLDLRNPAGYFLASNIEMRNKDVLFVSNAFSVESAKLMNYIRLINGTINDPIQTAISAYTLKGLIQGTGNVSVLSAPAPVITP